MSCLCLTGTYFLLSQMTPITSLHLFQVSWTQFLQFTVDPPSASNITKYILRSLHFGSLHHQVSLYCHDRKTVAPADSHSLKSILDCLSPRFQLFFCLFACVFTYRQFIRKWYGMVWYIYFSETVQSNK